MDQIARTIKDLGQALRAARKAKGLTQAELAARAGIWQRTVSNMRDRRQRRQGGDDLRPARSARPRTADRAAQQDDPA